MNILKRYIEDRNQHRSDYAYMLINLYDYARLGENDPSGKLSEEEKNEWRKKAIEYRDEIARYIMKGID